VWLGVGRAPGRADSAKRNEAGSGGLEKGGGNKSLWGVSRGDAQGDEVLHPRSEECKHKRCSPANA